VSVGIVKPFDKLFEGNRSHEQIYADELENCPEVKRRVMMGERCDVYRATKDYSYKSRQAAGEGWVLVGDAYGFLDPLYSSGVLLALRGGSVAADAINEALAKNDFSGKQLGNWAENFNEGMARMRRLVVEYYEGFSFGRFVRKHPEFKGHLTDLLIGNLFNDEVGKVFPFIDEMKAESKPQAAAK
jgi:flavin-dependent dehydrogenase